MPLVSSNQFNLNPNVAQAIGRGAVTGQQINQNFQRNQDTANATELDNQFRQLTSQVIDPSLSNEERLFAQRQRAAVNPERSQKVDAAGLKNLNSRNSALLNSVVLGAAEVNSIPSVEGKIEFMNNRIAQLQRDGLPTDDSEELRQLLLNRDEVGAQKMIDSVITVGQQAGILKTDTQINGGRFGVKSFAPITIVDPVTKEKRLVSPTINQTTGTSSLVPFDVPTDFVLSKETAEERRLGDIAESEQKKMDALKADLAIKPDIKKQEQLSLDAAKTANEAFSQVGNIRGNIINLREVIRLVDDEGANTGALESKLPSIKAASVKLDNLRNRLGLDVIGGVTFGALSKGELDLALNVALPTGLDGKPLVDWAKSKIEAQEKLANYFQEQATFLSVNGNTQAGWLAFKTDQKNNEGALPEGVTEDDITETMRARNMTRAEVLQKLGGQ